MPVTIAGEMSGQRLDKVLVLLGLVPSLRAARRLLQDGNALLNGLPARPGQKVAQHDRLSLASRNFSRPAQNLEAKLLSISSPYYCFYKPANMHTAALAGRHNQSLESLLPRILQKSRIAAGVDLLQRLDYPTSGLILGTDCETAANAYRQFENDGLVRKYYLAKLQGKLERRITVKNALAGNGCKKVRILEDMAEPLLWTTMEPIIANAEFTYACCVIKKGQRHQIRAHAKAAGFPLVGDELYGCAGDFLLHHCKLLLPEHEFFYLPDALISDCQAISKYLGEHR